MGVIGVAVYFQDSKRRREVDDNSNKLDDVDANKILVGVV